MKIKIIDADEKNPINQLILSLLVQTKNKISRTCMMKVKYGQNKNNKFFIK
jgi:hypothetical protein